MRPDSKRNALLADAGRKTDTGVYKRRRVFVKLLSIYFKVLQMTGFVSMLTKHKQGPLFSLSLSVCVSGARTKIYVLLVH